ncbi:MAG: adenosine kinase [Pseudomonadota bacterium]
MSKRDFKVCGIGGAIVDILSEVPEAFVADQAAQGMTKGGMMLIDAARARDIYAAMPPAIECSGGSGANTIACVASFGGAAAFIGVTADDQFGAVFRHDMKAMNVHISSAPIPATSDMATGQCLILVTPDAQRTMNTYLGAATQLDSAHVDAALIARSEMIYLEGYSFDSPLNKAAFGAAAKAARSSGTKIALTLSDSFCVDRHREDFLAFIATGVDVLFANAQEALHLTQTDTLNDAIAAIRQMCPLVAITCGADGSKIVLPDQLIGIAAVPPAHVLDTTGAGDAYAGGFLYGYTSGLALAECGHLGSLAAATVIAQMGPRPRVKLSTLLPSHLMTESAA